MCIRDSVEIAEPLPGAPSPGPGAVSYTHLDVYKRQAFHDAGLEVYLDVVYNHTAEGGHWEGDRDTTGFVSLGGFATTDYYVLDDNDMLIDGATGCSNPVSYTHLDVYKRQLPVRALVDQALLRWLPQGGGFPRPLKGTVARLMKWARFRAG